MGFEITHLNEGKIGIQLADNVNVEYASRQVSQVVFTAGKAFVISRILTFKPSILLKTSGNQPAFFDLNASFLIREKLWLGGSYRRGGAVAIVEYNVTKSLRIGYSLDFALTSLSRQNVGSHEIFLGYDLKLFKSGIISPRYF